MKNTIFLLVIFSCISYASKCLCDGNFFLPSNLKTATFRTFGVTEILSDYLWFLVLIPYVRSSVLPWRDEEWRKIISLYGFRTCPLQRRERRYRAARVVYCPRLFIVANAIQFRGSPILQTRVRDTRNLPMIQIPPVSFPLTASQIARVTSMWNPAWSSNRCYRHRASYSLALDIFRELHIRSIVAAK